MLPATAAGQGLGNIDVNLGAPGFALVSVHPVTLPIMALVLNPSPLL